MCLFTSGRASKSVYPRLFQVRADGVGPAQVLPLPERRLGQFFERRQYARICPGAPVAGGMEALSRRPDLAGVAGEHEDAWMSRKCRARTPTTRARFGSATRCISCPTATVRFRCSHTTPTTKQVQQVLENHGLGSEDRQRRIRWRWCMSNLVRCICTIRVRIRIAPFRFRSTASLRALEPHLAGVAPARG